MKATNNHPKLKTHPRPLFSCGFFCHCSHSSSSPTNPTSPTSSSAAVAALPPPPTPPSNHLPQKPESSSSSSSSSTSQSFTQWRFPLASSPLHPLPRPEPEPVPESEPGLTDVMEIFHAAELKMSAGSESEKISGLQLLERSLVPNPPSHPLCPPELMRLVVASLKVRAAAKPATKILLALCLAEGNRLVAVEAGVVGAVVEAAMEMELAAAERALAALELACTVAEGTAELRAHALAVPVMVTMMGKMTGRGREYAISALAVVYGNGVVVSGDQMQHAPPEEVARAVVLALQGDVTVRGRRKGAQLLKSLQDCGRSDLKEGENERP